MAGVPLPTSANVSTHHSTTTAPSATSTSPAACAGPTWLGRTMPLTARMRCGTTTRKKATNSVAYVSARNRISIHRPTHGRSRQLPHHVVVGLGPAVAEELPGAPHLFDHVQVHLGDHQLVLVLAAVRQEVAARVHEIAGAVELADVPRRFRADAIDAAHEVAVGDSVRGLLQFPQILRQSLHGRRRVEHDLGAVQPEQARALGEVAIVADVDADCGVTRLEDRIAQVPGLEEE